MSSLFLFSGAARRALFGFYLSSRTWSVSNCSILVPLCPSPSSSFIFFNTPGLAATISTTSSPTPGRRFFSSLEEVRVSADEQLMRVLLAQIKGVDQEKVDKEIYVPKDFPFEIVDNSGERMITLRRHNFCENIEVVVNWANWLDKKEEEIKEDEYFLHLNVKIDKGESTYLEVNGYFYPTKGFTIDEMNLKSQQISDDTEKYEGPGFGSLEGTLYVATLKYLKARGLDSSLWEFLKQYMKSDREHLHWLKNIRDFVTM